MSERSPQEPPPIEIEIVFDGGSLGNPGDGYGSYRLTVGDEPPRISRVAFGHATSNQAEYQTLIAALEDALASLETTGRLSSQTHLTLRGDSRLVLEQVRGTWKVRAPHLHGLRDRAAELISKFGSAQLLWQARANSVRILGH